MLSFLPGPVRGIIAILLAVINFFFWLIPLIPVAIIKLLIPMGFIRKLCDFMLNFICTMWASCNGIILKLLNKIEWDVEGDDNLSMKDWYLVIANHQSWVDIIVLQCILNNRIPYFRFFLKQELIWLPIFNFVWLALDYPYMKRYSKEFLEKNPHLKGKDIETTKNSCEKFKKVPVSVMNFVEGTRFTAEKHKKQNSPFKYLLKPKAGGVAFVLAAMGEQLTSMLDVTISYKPEAMGLWDLFCGRITGIKVRIKEIPLTSEIKGDYFEDEEFRAGFQEWVNKLWSDKDKIMKELAS